MTSRYPRVMNLLQVSSSNGGKTSPTEYILHGQWKTKSSVFYSYIPGVVLFQLRILFIEFYNLYLRDPDYRCVEKNWFIEMFLY